MRALCIRVGVLGWMIAFGSMAVVYAQRGESGTTGTGSAAESGAAAPETPPPLLTPPGGQTNPLRNSAGTTKPPRTAPDSRRPTADPFAGTTIPPAASDAATPAAGVEPASNGPSLPPRNATEGSRDSATNNRKTDSEPARFRSDPFATPMPASPANNRSDRTQPKSDLPAATGAGMENSEGTGRPGDPQLDGAQSPQVTIQKSAPKEIQVGRPAVFRVTVRNTGSVTACEVEIHDQIPSGTRLLATTPPARPGSRGELVWTVGSLRPGEESAVEMQLMPTAEGEIGSVATVHFGADASARCVATRPRLVVEATAPNRVMIGDQAMLSIVISNPGTGVATGVVLEERVPTGLQHAAGADLEYKVGDLKPGESRKLDLPLVARQPGPVTNVLRAHGEGDLRTEARCNIEVVAPLLDVAAKGPKQRFLERQATYQLSVTNPGTAAARGVELVATLPAGLKFLSANNAGYYEEASRTVRWRLEELPANETGVVELVTLPTEPGNHAIRLRGTADKGLVAEKEQPVLVQGIAAILFQVTNTANPVEIGGETAYEVRVINQGSKAAANVRLTVLFPPELQPTTVEGPTRYATDANRVLFDGLSQLAPKAQTTYRIHAKALRPGDLRVRFQLATDDMQTPVTKEESTRVYADE
jgi:uncharacterized repeat protein (TIGR01451 family)